MKGKCAASFLFLFLPPYPLSFFWDRASLCRSGWSRGTDGAFCLFAFNLLWPCTLSCGPGRDNCPNCLGYYLCKFAPYSCACSGVECVILECEYSMQWSDRCGQRSPHRFTSCLCWSILVAISETHNKIPLTVAIPFTPTSLCNHSY